MLQLRHIFLCFLALCGYVVCYGQCSSVILSSNVNSGCAPLLVTFSVNNAPEASKFGWDFGSGEATGQDTMQKAFTSAGKYPVELFVTLADGSVCSTLFDTITVLAPPSPTISVLPGQLLCGNTKTAIFSDQTPDVMTREWIIDGSSFKNASSSINYTFGSAGSKSVSLIMTDSNGCTGTFSNNKYMQVYDSAQTDFCADINYSKTSVKAVFTANVSAPNRTLLSVSWSFPGGSPSSYSGQAPPMVTYTTPVDTSYDVSMTATMQDGCTYTVTRKSFIQPFISYPSDSMCINVPFSVTNKAVGNGRGFYSWQFPGATLVDASKNKIEYSSAGQFDLVLSFKYALSGCYTNVTYSKAVTVAGPSADFTMPVRTGCQAPFIAKLVNTSVSFGAKNVNYVWHIYNDTTHKEIHGSPIGPTPVADTSIIIKHFGKYDVALVAYSGRGCYDSIFKQSYINISRPKADFKVDYTNTCLGNSIQFTNATTPPDDSANPYRYSWKMQNMDSLGINYSYSSREVQFRPSVPGNYSISLIVKNASGCSDTINKLNYVSVNGAIASASVSNTGGCPPFISSCTANVKYSYPSGIKNSLKYAWAVSPNDGGVAILSPSSISSVLSVTKTNCYNVSLYLSDSLGCSNKVQVNSQLCSGVAPKFHLDSGSCLFTTIQSHNNSPNKPDRYKWLGKPASYIKFIPSDTVASPGIEYLKDTCYSISLVAYKLYGSSVCTDTASTYSCTHSPKAGFTSKNVQDSCAPQIVSFKNSSLNAINFFWDFGDGETLATGAMSTSHLYKRNNSTGYTVKLVAVNSAGCTDTFVQKNYIKIIGPMPFFDIDNNTGCDSLKVHFTNLSKNVNNILMDYGDGSALDSFVSPYHTYKINDPGKDSEIYYPALLAINISQCSAYHEDTIKLYRTPVSNFSANVFSGCVPLTVSFIDKSLHAQKSYWDFDGDGRVDAAGKTPVFNYTSPGIYNVTLRAENTPGCGSIKTKTNYIQVYAYPRASFSLNTHSLCGSGGIEFTNTSADFTSYKISYGDGSHDDSLASAIPISTHIYSFNAATGGALQVFIPLLTAYNNNGCVGVFSDTIKVYPKPSAIFYADRTSGCAPLSVKLSDISKYTVSRQWYYDNSNKPGDTAKTPIHIFSAGLHSVKLKTISISGCEDSSIINNYIQADPVPIAGFYAKDTDICYNAPLQFTDKSLVANKIVRWQWDFNEPSSPNDTSGDQNPSFTFNAYGNHTVSLRVTDQLGCTSPAYTKSIYVEDTLPPVNSEIDYVTVDNFNRVQVYWNKNTYSKFNNYTLYQNGSPVISVIANVGDTSFTQADTAGDHVNGQPVCYTIQSGDKCGDESGLSSSHCTISLSANSISPTTIQLKWTAYTGWGAVRNYTVYRSADGGAFTQIATLPGSNFSYIDTNLCDKNYCYYVEVMHPLGLYSSQSNRACSHPPYVYQASPLSLLSVSVSGNNSILIKWAPGLQSDIKKYGIDRFDGQNWQYNYMSTTATQITDNNVKPAITSYSYKVRAEDDCGNTSPPSNTGKSVLLSTRIVNDAIGLDWNSYKCSGAPPYAYVIQVMGAGHKFAAVNTTQDTSYIDDSVYTNTDTAWLYRICVFDDNIPPDTSISNISFAVLPSRIFVPNAFTPNHDGLNEVWKVSALSVYNVLGNEALGFNVKIFDRWGALIFESNDINRGWDGMINGKKADEGTYLYVMRASGLDGRKFYLKGKIELLY